jgi:hypothetical protein
VGIAGASGRIRTWTLTVMISLASAGPVRRAFARGFLALVSNAR